VTVPIQVLCPPVPAKSKAVARPVPEGPSLALSCAAARTTVTPSVFQFVVLVIIGSVLHDSERRYTITITMVRPL
jgi:hypothetical protein